MTRVLFLPGASGSGEFWAPVAERLPKSWDSVLFDWPGLGDVPPDPRVRSLDDLAALVLNQLAAPADLVAQSMGGAVAMRVALSRPDLVRRMVLVATSGGVDLSRFGVADWRADYRAEYPNAAPFISDAHDADLSDHLVSVTAPTLLLWAQGDAISPPAVGEHLQTLLPVAQLRVLPYSDHMFARDHADAVAPLIERHLH